MKWTISSWALFAVLASASGVPSASAQSVSPANAPPPATAYTTGPINGTLWAWPINYGSMVSESFTTTTSATNLITVGLWIPNCLPVTDCQYPVVDLSIGTSSFGSDVANITGLASISEIVHNTVGPVGICWPNGCTVYAVTYSLESTTLNPFTVYWITLQNASLPTQSPVYWDQNNNVGCAGFGCPSAAQSDFVGSIPAESLTVTF